MSTALTCTHLIKSLKSRKDKINSKGSEGKLSKLSAMDVAILEPDALMGGTKLCETLEVYTGEGREKVLRLLVVLRKETTRE